MSESNYWQQVAGQVRAEMARQRKTTAELATTLGVHKETARFRLNGERPFGLIELAKVAAWLQVDIDALAGSEAVA